MSVRGGVGVVGVEARGGEAGALGPVAAGRKGRGAGGGLGEVAEGGWKAGVSVFLRASSVVFPGGKRREIKYITVA